MLQFKNYQNNNLVIREKNLLWFTGHVPEGQDKEQTTLVDQ